MPIETFNFDLVEGVEHEFPFEDDSAFVLVRNRSIYPIFLYLKDDSGYNATPVTISGGKDLPLPITTDAVKCLSAQGGPVVVVAVPQAEYGGVGPQGETGPQGPDGEDGEDGADGLDGADGVDGDNSYVYIAYASDSSGTGFTMTFNASLDYIAIKSTTVEIPSPVVGDFVGLWKNYKGVTGATGSTGSTGATGPEGPQGPQGDPGVDALQLQYYESSELSVAAQVTQAHGLGVRPDFAYCVLRCVTGSSIHAVGDEIPVAYGAAAENSEENYPRAYFLANATQFIFRCSSPGNDFLVLDSDGAIDTDSFSDWRVVFKALTRPA